jgi:hypothetical protein
MSAQANPDDEAEESCHAQADDMDPPDQDARGRDRNAEELQARASAEVIPQDQNESQGQ